MTNNPRSTLHGAHTEAEGGGACPADHAPPPAYVVEALRGLTTTQKKYVIAGTFHGDCTMATIRALRNKALFYHHIDSPNGRAGPMKLTPLGVTVQGILKARKSRKNAEVTA